MTTKDSTLLNQNVRLSIATIFTLIGCTATFVWKGAQFATQIANKVDNCQADTRQLKSEQKVLAYRVAQLETAAAIAEAKNRNDGQ